MIPKFARYNYCIKKSIEFLLLENVNRFPFDSDIIIARHKWARLKYSNLARQLNIDIDDIINANGSKDGYSTYNGRNYTISYNNSQIPKRIYFTKLHEIGHIYLKHFIDFDETILSRSQISEKQYKVLENEANCFARNVIAPAIIVKHFNLNTYQKISSYFGITEGAAKARLDLLEYDYKYISKVDEKNLINLFSTSIHKKFCLRCNSSFDSKYFKYCPICGNDNFKWGDGKMIYSKIELNENHKAKICPRCENEITNIKGEYCQICGNHITNKCTNDFCENLLGDDMRYCPLCGHSSTFLDDNFLNNWEYELREQNELDEVESHISGNNTEISDEMPF
ncbi:ImmA/IrrE family metallo-endopeptidase [Clostridium sp.]|uniref:ImmA/IrrE family metallo-endopeptidase n=1 Tax=Clostridium sp. TaxID=1506 RepID=UPI002FC70773